MLKLYAGLAALAIIIGLATTIYVKGRNDAAQATLITQLRLDAAAQAEQMRRNNSALAADQLRARADAERQSQLQARITGLNDYIDALEDGSTVCLSDDDTKRLSDLWDSPPGAKPPAHPK